MRLDILEDIAVVSRGGELYMDTSTLYAGFLRESLKVRLQKFCDFLPCQKGKRDSNRLACCGFNFQRVGILNSLRFGAHGDLWVEVRLSVAGTYGRANAVAVKISGILVRMAVDI